VESDNFSSEGKITFVESDNFSSEGKITFVESDNFSSDQRGKNHFREKKGTIVKRKGQS